MILDSSVNLFREVCPFQHVHFAPVGFGRDLPPWAMGDGFQVLGVEFQVEPLTVKGRASQDLRSSHPWD